VHWYVDVLQRLSNTPHLDSILKEELHTLAIIARHGDIVVPMRHMLHQVRFRNAEPIRHIYCDFDIRITIP